jgi:Flp pilus assembly pilin Flp
MVNQSLKKEDDAQVVECALIIVLISIGLVLALLPSTIAASFENFIGRFNSFLTKGHVFSFFAVYKKR